jgi:uncharacterized protein YfbU (UPF0304 family)
MTLNQKNVAQLIKALGRQTKNMGILHGADSSAYLNDIAIVGYMQGLECRIKELERQCNSLVRWSTTAAIAIKEMSKS